MRSPTVSAIVPVHNYGRYVADSILSVLQQSHEVLECIVVDDGSTDDTPEVLASFGGAIVVVRQENLGVAAARNAGMRRARGDYFAFLDADDVWLPDKIEVQLGALAACPDASAAYSGFVITDEDLRWRRLVVHSGGTRSLRRAFAGRSSGLGFSFTGQVKREAVETVGPFDERLSNCADIDFWWRLAQRRRVIGVRRPLALYRQHPHGQMHREFDRAVVEYSLVWARAEHAGFGGRTLRRARANLEAHIGAQLLLQHELAAGMAHLTAAVHESWLPLVLVPPTSAGRRITQSLGARAYRLLNTSALPALEMPPHPANARPGETCTSRTSDVA